MIHRLLERRPEMIPSGTEPQLAYWESINGVANDRSRPKAAIRGLNTRLLIKPSCRV